MDNESTVSEFILLGLPIRAEDQGLYSALFLAMYLTTVLGNLLIILAIGSDPHLHTPMYFFLSALSFSETCYTLTIIPKMLVDLIDKDSRISVIGCGLQMCFFLGLGGTNCILLTVMGYDRFLAICNPLRHATIFSPQLTTCLGAGALLRAFILVSPSILLIKCRLKYFRTTIISHSYCEHMAIVKLAAQDIRINKICGLLVAFAILGFDIVFITFSYVRIFITVFQLPQKEARFKAFNTCIAHICVFLQFYLLAFFSFFTHRFGAHIPPYVHILLSDLYLLVPPFLNPIVYGVRTKKIRDYVLNTLKVKGS